MTFRHSWSFENCSTFTTKTIQDFLNAELLMQEYWKQLLESLGKDGKTPKAHDATHKPWRILLFGPTKIMPPGDEKFHRVSVKMAYTKTNKKDVLPQIVDQASRRFFAGLFETPQEQQQHRQQPSPYCLSGQQLQETVCPQIHAALVNHFGPSLADAWTLIPFSSLVLPQGRAFALDNYHGRPRFDFVQGRDGSTAQLKKIFRWTDTSAFVHSLLFVCLCATSDHVRFSLTNRFRVWPIRFVVSIAYMCPDVSDPSSFVLQQ